MPNIELTDDEKKTLTEVLESAVSDLGYEIADTDNFDYRAGLKARKEALSAILERLKSDPG
ncbi:MAG TPA: hypothetical protein ENI85_02945 [Deltaproteobacteria bacterium]|nr:hypothetical protein [Deltaproteobacteria bacterium]